MFWLFGHEACGILAPQSRIESAPLALEGETLTTGPLGKFPGSSSEWAVVKNLPGSAGDEEDVRSTPGAGRSLE